MILSDREIESLVEMGAITIDPFPPRELRSSSAIDLTLHKVLLRWVPRPTSGGPDAPIRPSAPNFNVQGMMNDPRYAARIEISPTDGYVMEPGTFILGFTEQAVRLPHRNRIAARVEGKSSLARLGLGVHVTAPTIHAGFGTKDVDSAPIQLEIFNLGPFRIRLDVGMPICQLVFEEVRETPSAGYQGQFSSQRPFTITEPSVGSSRRQRGRRK
jgi:dCTP deaminase